MCTPEWLALREPADAAARSDELVARLRPHLPDGPIVVHDLGCGTGSMGRWLAPRLAGTDPRDRRRPRGLQHWVLHDRDPRVLARAAESMPPGVTVETRLGEFGAVERGASLVTASALLDLLTEADVERIARCGCPALLTLTVVGQVSLHPTHPLDAAFAAAFDDHQRREGRLGPDAVAATARAFRRHGAAVASAASPWHLGPEDAELAREWLLGWVDAACVQNPRLVPRRDTYLHRRFAALERGELRIVVGHADLLALPGEQA